MYKSLEEIGSITTGVYGKWSPSGGTFDLQAKHFDEKGKFREDNLISPEIHMEDRLEKHILQDKDLLITAKGERNRVCIYRSTIGPSVASSTFFVVRLHEPGIMPEYLQWYLNTARMQSLLSSLSKGTRILSLSKKSLSKVKIEIPPVEQQQEILKLQSLWDAEQKNTMELLEQKEIYYQNLLLYLATSKLTKQ